MEREKPPLLYIYQYIRRIENEHSEYKEFSGCQIGEVIFIKKEIMNENYWKPIGTYQEAFVGDMQEKLDIAMKRKHMEHYAKYHKCPTDRSTYTRVYIEKDYSLKGFWQYFLSKFKKEEKPDMYLENLLFGDKFYSKPPISYIKENANLYL